MFVNSSRRPVRRSAWPTASLPGSRWFIVCRSGPPTGNTSSESKGCDWWRTPDNALAPLAETARQYLRQAKSDNTRRAYRADWGHFEACAAHQLAPLLAREQTLVLYFSELAATHKVSSLQRRLAAISQAHQVADFETPTRGLMIRNLLAGIGGRKGPRPL